MKITFLGGTETVTGSKFLVQSEKTQLLVDCGLFQGYKWLRERNWQSLPLDIQDIDGVVLTHAHLDHSGYLPVLYRRGYRGPVYAHRATKALCDILLVDSGHLQEEGARYLGKHHLSKHQPPQPLYDAATAEACLQLFQPVNFGQSFRIGDIECHLQGAGHILGAGSLILRAEGKSVGFSGDIGRPHDLLMRPPKPLPTLDLLLLESTYGNRLHDAVDPMQALAQVVNQTVARGGVLLIPAFAVGRTQAIQMMLNRLVHEQAIPSVPIFLDSPMAQDVSEIYTQFADDHKISTAECLSMCRTTQFVRSVTESKALADINYPHIIIAGSGMATGGRILHHFSRWISNPKTTVLFTGFQAGGTRGAKLVGGADTLKVHGQWLNVKAQVAVLHGLSGHADYLEMLHWLQSSQLAKHTPIQLIHGDPDALEAMRDYLSQHTQYRVSIATHHSILTL